MKWYQVVSHFVPQAVTRRSTSTWNDPQMHRLQCKRVYVSSQYSYGTSLFCIDAIIIRVYLEWKSRHFSFCFQSYSQCTHRREAKDKRAKKNKWGKRMWTEVWLTILWAEKMHIANEQKRSTCHTRIHWWWCVCLCLCIEMNLSTQQTMNRKVNPRPL